MSHKAMIMVPVLLDLNAADVLVAKQEARDKLRDYQSFTCQDNEWKRYEPKLLAFYEDKELRELPPPPFAA